MKFRPSVALLITLKNIIEGSGLDPENFRQAVPPFGDSFKSSSLRPRDRPAIQISFASPFTLRRQTLRDRRCSFLASHARRAAPSSASVRVIGSILGAEEIPAVIAIPLSRRRIRRLVSFFPFRPIFFPIYSQRDRDSSLIAARFLRLNGEIPPSWYHF
jgi:hypothetical protein